MIKNGRRATARVPLHPSAWSSALELRQLRAFTAVVESGSITAAAQALGLAQSTVSESLAALERALGTPALARRRGTHAIALTTAGRALLPHARGVLAALDEAHAAVAAATRAARGTVGVIANESLSTYVLPRALGALRERWPGTRFAVTVATCASVREGLARGRFDVGLLLRGEERVAARKHREAAGRAAVPLADVTLALFCGPDHPLARASEASAVPRDRLTPYPVFVTDASGDFHRLLRDFFRADGLPGPRLEPTGTIESVKRSVATSPRALGVLPGYALAEDLRNGLVRLVAVRPALPRVKLEGLLCRARRTPPAAAELLDVLRASLASPEPGL